MLGNQLVFVSALIIIFILLCVLIFWLLNIKNNQLTVEKDAEQKIESYNNLFDVLIESNTHPTMIVDYDYKIRFINTNAVSELGVGEQKILPKKFAFIYSFMDSDSIHSQMEVKINKNHYLVSISKFKTQILEGSLLNFTNITQFKEAQEIHKTFVQNASHELKTPISAIQGICEIILDNKVHDKETLNDFVSLISKENERLKSIIASLTLPSGVQPVYHRFYTHDMLKEIELFFKNFNEDDDSKKINFVTKNLIEHEVKQDEKLITQILINLIENAFKYTNEGNIIVSAYMKDKKICFSIKDTGIGIDPEDINSIFKRFYRVDKSRSRETGGSGLGLSIVKELVEALGGRIEVLSKVEKGTEFTLYLKNIE
ncbi:signal transduction histidine kinase [Bacilli bacterium PM5-3]|nr:signal transduction histidine kinase [Bacilli bacterium PM5-3]MDH6603416.1 signal transduction histidine kinase [Bacilli bacterium PM5-9]